MPRRSMYAPLGLWLTVQNCSVPVAVAWKVSWILLNTTLRLASLAPIAFSVPSTARLNPFPLSVAPAWTIQVVPVGTDTELVKFHGLPAAVNTPPAGQLPDTLVAWAATAQHQTVPNT